MYPKWSFQIVLQFLFFSEGLLKNRDGGALLWSATSDKVKQVDIDVPSREKCNPMQMLQGLPTDCQHKHFSVVHLATGFSQEEEAGLRWIAAGNVLFICKSFI